MRHAHAVFSVGLTVVLLLVSCSSASREKPPTAEGMKHLPVLEGEHAFALNLYARLKQGEENLFFSPFSITTALAMTYAGARGNTAAQMATACGFDLPPERLHAAFAALIADLNSKERKQRYELVVANALWGDKRVAFAKEFLDLVEKSYGGGLRQVDFTDPEAARGTINRWVEEQTRGRVADLVSRDAMQGAIALVLTNAIYFKSKWAFPFDSRATRDEPFTLPSGRRTSVATMNQEAHGRYAEGEDFQVLELLYKGRDVSMVIFLPKKADGLPAFEKSLTGDRLSKCLSGLRDREVIVSLPRFRIAGASRLGEILVSLGMTDAFNPKAADFSAMGGPVPIWIAAVLHRAFVDVTEEGTEAAAATAVIMKAEAKEDQPPPVFRADHPFLFLIRDTKSGTVLFMGRVMNPKE